MKVYRENLRDALSLAILMQERFEQDLDYTSDSALLGGWKELRDGLEQRTVSVIELKESPQ